MSNLWYDLNSYQLTATSNLILVIMGAKDDFVNLLSDGSGLPPVPLMSRDTFARAIGIPVGVVIGWCERGYIPTISIGKYSLINVELVRKQCMSKEFAL